MAKKILRKLPSRSVCIFKLKNRRGYGALCHNHLTEGRTSAQAFARMVKAVKRSGFALSGSVPRTR